ncbi:hypothetical protein RRG08_019563 [Elysia crispata]|uniref:Uncharacterized protein n=1 Tax=Elysia crispata TaxID=231223 RepID=A0AAE0YRP7_9GAST|nr:hypothetical protein RRG08_019563 [Elysia crispata]
MGWREVGWGCKEIDGMGWREVGWGWKEIDGLDCRRVGCGWKEIDGMGWREVGWGCKEIDGMGCREVGWGCKEIDGMGWREVRWGCKEIDGMGWREVGWGCKEIDGRVKGTDDDSEYNQNNWVYFGGGGGNFDIAANGWIVLNQRCLNGETYTGTCARATAETGGGGVCGCRDLVGSNHLPDLPLLLPGEEPVLGLLQKQVCVWGVCVCVWGGVVAVTWLALTICLTYLFCCPCRNPCSGYCRNRCVCGGVGVCVGAVTWLALTICLAYRFCCPCRNPCSGYCRNSRDLVGSNHLPGLPLLLPV